LEWLGFDFTISGAFNVRIQKRKIQLIGFLVLPLVSALIVLRWVSQDDSDWPLIYIWSAEGLQRINENGSVTSNKERSNLRIRPLPSLTVELTSSGASKPSVALERNGVRIGSIQVTSDLREFSCGHDWLVVLKNDVEIANTHKWAVKSSPFRFAVGRKDSFAEVHKPPAGPVEIKQSVKQELARTVVTQCSEAYEVTGLDVLELDLAYCTRSTVYVYSKGSLWSRSAPSFGSFSGVRLTGDGRIAVIVMSNSPLSGSWSRVELYSEVRSMRSSNVYGAFLLVDAIDHVEGFK
jgi:hypothetical protein